MADHELRLQLGRHFQESRRARAHLREFCAGLPTFVVDTAETLTSELVTNAIMHGHGVIGLFVSLIDDTLRVTVSDEGPERPRLGPPTTDPAHGRGLSIIGALAKDWGVTRSEEGPGKSVWFSLSVR